MDTKEAQNEYKKRGSTVEAPFGILKILLQLQQPKNTWNTTNRKYNELMCTITQHKKIIQHKTQHTQRNTEIDNFLEKLSTLFETELIATIK